MPLSETEPAAAGWSSSGRVRRPRRRHQLRHADVDVTLIDRVNHHLFQPLLYQAALGGLSGERLCVADPGEPEALSNTQFLMAEVTDVDAERREVVLDRGERLGY